MVCYGMVLLAKVFLKNILGGISLKIDLMDWHGERRYAIYDDFQIRNETVSSLTYVNE